MKRISSWVLVALIITIIFACSYNNVREIEPDQSFSGLDAFFMNDAGTSDTKSLNVVFVHGMGHHPFGEPGVRKYQKRIAKELGFSSKDVQSVTWGGLCTSGIKSSDFLPQQLQLTREGEAGLITEKALLKELEAEKQAVCPLRINNVIVGYVGWRQYQNTNSDGTRVLNLFELSWDRATELLQKTILELDENYNETVELNEDLEPIKEEGRDREKDRALVNRWLKKFVNSKLGDPVIYLGTYGDSIRQTVADGLLKISSVEGTSKQTPYVIISDSLGSRVVFDTLDCALGPTPKDGSECKSSKLATMLSGEDKDKLGELTKNTVQVFMNANQLPFLAMSRATAPEPGQSEENWLKRQLCDNSISTIKDLGKALKDKKDGRLAVQIIAFTDPNDALSYHLTQRFRNHCSRPASNDISAIKFINVRISNAKWNYGFVLANPDKAHSGGFRENNTAIEMVVHGYKTEEP